MSSYLYCALNSKWSKKDIGFNKVKTKTTMTDEPLTF